MDVKRLVDSLRNEWVSQPASTLVAWVNIVAVVVNFAIAAPLIKTPFAISKEVDPLGGHLIVRAALFVLLEGALATLFGRLLVVFRKQGDGTPWVLMIVTSFVSAWISYFNCFWIFVTASSSYEGALISYSISIALAFLFSWRFVYTHFESEEQRFEIKYAAGEIKDHPRDYMHTGFWWAFWMTVFAYAFATIVGISEINLHFTKSG